MKKVIVSLSMICSIFLLTNCHPKHKLAGSEKTPAEQIADAKKNYTADQLSQGKMIFENNCAKCHKLHLPEEHTVDKWNNVLPRMIKRAELSDNDAALVHAYIIANAQQG